MDELFRTYDLLERGGFELTEAQQTTVRQRVLRKLLADASGARFWMQMGVTIEEARQALAPGEQFMQVHRTVEHRDVRMGEPIRIRDE